MRREEGAPARAWPALPFSPYQARLTRSPENNGAGLVQLAAGKVNHALVANHDFLDQIALSQGHVLRVVKGGGNLAAWRGNELMVT